MGYHQNQYSFYNPTMVRISIGNADSVVTYVEQLDETCVEYHHVHEDSYEIYHCLEGTHNLLIDTQCHTLTAGSFALLRPGVHHHTLYEPDVKKRYCVFVFTPPSVSTVRSKGTAAQAGLDAPFSATQYFVDHPFFISQDLHNAGKILEILSQELSQDLPGKSQMVSSLYQQYLISIFRHLLPAGEKQPSHSGDNINLTIAITKYLHANYQKNITIQDVSEKFLISSRHLNRIFKAFFGHSFKRTLNIYRINYAKNYFISTDYSVEKVARLVGFSSPKALYQIFKEEEGMTISQFRAQHQKRQGGGQPPGGGPALDGPGHSFMQ